MERPELVVHISHIDLDGYTCSYLYHQAMSNAIGQGTQQPFNLIHLNVNYPELTACLMDVLSGDALPTIDHLLITDLNLKDDDVTLLQAHSNHVKRLTLLDHHHNDEDRLNGLLEHRRSVLGATEDEIVLTKGVSATQHLIDWLDAHQIPIHKHARTFATYVNAWDVHDFASMEAFRKGQLINDVLTDVIRLAPSAVNDNGVLDVVNAAIVGMCGAMPYDESQDDLPYTAPGFESVLKRCILEALSDYTCNKDGLPLAETENTLTALGWLQALSYLLSRLYNANTDDASKLTIGEGTRVLIVEAPMAMALVHHLLYSVKALDVVAVLHPGKRVELRQNSLNETVNLARVAKRFGGGGHISAAGCPWPDQVPSGLELNPKGVRLPDGRFSYDAVADLMAQALEQEASY